MSLDFPTLDNNVRISSFSDFSRAKQILNFYNESWPEFKRVVEWRDDQYGILLNSLWMSYTRNKNHTPSFSGYALDEGVFVYETLHYLFPGWLKDISEFTPSRRSLFHWLDSSRLDVRLRLEKRNFSLIYNGLEEGIESREDQKNSES